MLNPPINLLNDEEAAIVVAILRDAGDLSAANRALCERFLQWDLAQRLAGLRQAQNMILRDWQKNPERRRRAQLVGGHGPEEHKEGRPESRT